MPPTPTPHYGGPIRTISGNIVGPYPTHSQRHSPVANENLLGRTSSLASLGRASSGQSEDHPFLSSGMPPNGIEAVPMPTSTYLRGSSGFDERQAFRGPPFTAMTDAIANELGLNDEDRLHLHAMSQMSPAEQSILKYARSIQISRQNEEIISIEKEILEEAKAIKERTSEKWTMSDVQEELVKEIVQHWLVKPVNSYGAAVNRSVEKYVSQNAAKLHLNLYNTDPIIKRTVDKFIAHHQTQQRSNNHRGLAASLKNNEPLSVYTARMIHEYAMGSEKKKITNANKAQFALMRQIRQEIVDSGRAMKKGDSGFWKDMDRELEQLVKKFSKDRAAPQWEEWYMMMIAEDEEHFGKAVEDELPGLNLEPERDSDEEEES